MAQAVLDNYYYERLWIHKEAIDKALLNKECDRLFVCQNFYTLIYLIVKILQKDNSSIKHHDHNCKCEEVINLSFKWIFSLERKASSLLKNDWVNCFFFSNNCWSSKHLKKYHLSYVIETLNLTEISDIS